MKMIHILVRAGARWEPEGRAVGAARKEFLKMRSDYTVEFLWIMAGACSRETAQKLMAKPTIKTHVSEHSRRLDEIVASFVQEW